MRSMNWFSSVLLLFLSLPPAAQAMSHSRQVAPLADELEARYPKPPARLETDPTMSSVLLLDIDLKGSLGNSEVSGAALVTGDSGPIRAAPIKGDLVMFHTLQPGNYALRFIRVDVYIGGDVQPRKTLALQIPLTIQINATVARGGIHYLGTVVVKGKVGVFGDKPPEFQLTYDARRELAAWTAFGKKYADSPWSALVDQRMLALRSRGAAATPSKDSANRAPVSDVGPGGPLSKLSGEWDLTVLLMGAGEFGGLECGKRERPGPPSVNIAPPSDGAVSLHIGCNDSSDYSFRLGHDSATQAYVLTVSSKAGISVQDFPVAYNDTTGWNGKRDQLVEGQTQLVTAMVAPIEGRLWRGWMIAVLPTEGIDRGDDLKKPYVRADLTRRR